MIKNGQQYKAVMKHHDALDKAVNEYKKKVDADKDNLHLKIQLDVFNGQLNEANQELEAYNNRTEFRKYAKKGNDEKVFEMSFANPSLKHYLNKEQLIRLSDYYESNIKNFVLGSFVHVNEIVKDLTNRLENTNNFMKKNIKRN